MNILILSGPVEPTRATAYALNPRPPRNQRDCCAAAGYLPYIFIVTVDLGAAENELVGRGGFGADGGAPRSAYVSITVWHALWLVDLSKLEAENHHWQSRQSVL